MNLSLKKAGVALALLLTFGLALLTTADLGHCRDACEGCPELGLCEPGLLLQSAERGLQGALGEGDQPSHAHCLGAGCLCHQHRVPPGQGHPLAPTVSALTEPNAPLTPTLDVTREILHVPKPLS